MKNESGVFKNTEKEKGQVLKYPEVHVKMTSFYPITQIRRIPRYELLIRDMLKDVGKDFPDVDQLKKAYLEAKESAKASNTLKCLCEDGEKAVQVPTLLDSSSIHCHPGGSSATGRCIRSPRPTTRPSSCSTTSSSTTFCRDEGPADKGRDGAECRDARLDDAALPQVAGHRQRQRDGRPRRV